MPKFWAFQSIHVHDAMRVDREITRSRYRNSSQELAAGREDPDTIREFTHVDVAARIDRYTTYFRARDFVRPGTRTSGEVCWFPIGLVRAHGLGAYGFVAALDIQVVAG